ncbi:MAG: hypothetical protein FWD68_06520 [Alphaproteobacteria bacterium]|nr:hypothetical protein [Alphaproteobacteria bacterium]
MTDIWQWVSELEEELRDDGRSRIADLIDRIPGAEVEEAEAMLPEALAAARSLRHSWLEVFFRHWGLQARIARGGEGTRALREAVELLEFAHRDDTIGCPQSVCTAHDLLCCYANVDGLGWAEERISLAAETLERVEPSCVCFDCISGEYADALIDQGRHDEAQAFLEAQGLRLREAGGDSDFGFRNILVRSFLHTRGPAHALERLEQGEDPADDHFALDSDLLRAQCLASVGRVTDAIAALPAFSDLAGGHYRAWGQAVDAIVAAAPERNNWQLGRQLATAIGELEGKGAHRNCLTIALQHARLALTRGSLWTARRALDAARRQLPQLRRDGGAAEAILELEQRIAAEPAGRLPVPAGELLAHLQTIPERNPEHDIELLALSCRERPDDEDLVLAASLASEACGAPTSGHELLWAFLEKHPQSTSVALRLLDLSLGHGNADMEVTRLAGFVEASQEQIARWCLVRLAQEKGRWREVAQRTAEIMALAPDFEFAAVHGLAARAAMEEGDLARAALLRRVLAEHSDQPGAADWDLLTAASALGDWDMVRWSAARLGMKLTDAEGPVREEWGWIRVAFEDEGRSRLYVAQRTGPVTAQVVEIARPGVAQHVHDEVVFDAALLEPVPEDEEERESWLPPFRVVHVSRAGGCVSWLLDGADPGKESLARLRTALEADEWLLRRVSSDDYAVADPEREGATLPGICLFLATPATTPAAQIDARLRDLTGGFAHPWAWLDLARAAGGDTERHQHIIKRYGL